MKIKLLAAARRHGIRRQTRDNKIKVCGIETSFPVKFIFQLLLAFALPLPLFSQEAVQVTGAKVTEVGIYSSKVITDQTNAAGVKLQGLDEFKLVMNTTNIPARVGTRFGFRYEILGVPANAPIILSMIARHPPIKNSTTGRTETTDSYRLKSWIGKTYTSGSLDEPSDCVPGPWTFEVWYGGKMLCEQSFLVVPDTGTR